MALIAHQTQGRVLTRRLRPFQVAVVRQRFKQHYANEKALISNVCVCVLQAFTGTSPRTSQAIIPSLQVALARSPPPWAGESHKRSFKREQPRSPQSMQGFQFWIKKNLSSSLFFILLSHFKKHLNNFNILVSIFAALMNWAATKQVKTH